MRHELQRLGLMLRWEVRGERLPRGRTGHAAGMLIRPTARRPMKAELEQPSALQTGEGIRRMDPNPLADDLREPPLAADPTPNGREDLGERQGPMLLMDRATELARQANRLRPRRRRPRSNRLRLRLTY